MEISSMELERSGLARIGYISTRMPVLAKIKQDFESRKPLEGIKISACLHVTTETACLMLALRSGGAQIALTGSNPLSTQDDVAAALRSLGIQVYAKRGQTQQEYYQAIRSALEIQPQLILDDGADAIVTAHSLGIQAWGGCEETTTGVNRLRAMAAQHKLGFPVIAVNNAETKLMFDNRYGTGQSVLHGIMNATNRLICGSTLVVIGYGWCGRGIASRARGMGAQVIVCEVNPRKALEAAMDGFRVMKLEQAAPLGEIFITATGNISVIDSRHYQLMKDGAILANAGHFDVELNIPELESISIQKSQIAPNLAQYTLKDGRKLYLLCQGRLVNLVAAYGHPPEVMDLSFSNQALCVEYLVNHHSELKPGIYDVPPQIDQKVAQLKLESMGIQIDELTPAQQEYLRSWEWGT